MATFSIHCTIFIFRFRTPEGLYIAAHAGVTSNAMINYHSKCYNNIVFRNSNSSSDDYIIISKQYYTAATPNNWILFWCKYASFLKKMKKK